MKRTIKPSPKPRRKVALKLPTLAAFTKMTPLQRARIFLRWVKTKKGGYDYWDQHRCALACFGRVLTPLFKKAGGREIFLTNGKKLVLDEGFSVCASVQYPNPDSTYKDLAERLSIHLASRSEKSLTISPSDLLPHLEALNILIAQGWDPCINILSEYGVWHVGLNHQSLGRPVVTISGGRQTCNYDGSKLSIHTRAPSLDVALEQAIAQAQGTPIS